MVTLLLLALAVLPDGVRSYRVYVEGQEDGAARLAIHPRADGSFSYAWDSQIGLSREPCLRSEEHVEGSYVPGRPVPDELALSFGLHPAGTAAVLGRDGLPEHVEVSGVVYAAAAAGELRWDRCWPHGLSGGLPIQGVPDDLAPRHLARASFTFDGLPGQDARGFDGPMPEAVARAAAAAFRRAPDQDCKVVARGLAAALGAAGYAARVEEGLLLDRGRLWPHAWTRVRVDGAWRDLDATTGTGWADAGRIDVGPLDGAAGWRTGLAMLRYLRARPTLASFRAEDR